MASAAAERRPPWLTRVQARAQDFKESALAELHGAHGVTAANSRRGPPAKSAGRGCGAPELASSARRCMVSRRDGGQEPGLRLHGRRLDISARLALEPQVRSLTAHAVAERRQSDLPADSWSCTSDGASLASYEDDGPELSAAKAAALPACNSAKDIGRMPSRPPASP
eukprot:CAMPEP_0170428412 /NCGR_PEP_ID=MMETSP0117_2-20130122/39755_1 /TAXON_ID=400756 /ORGANISM="Durinskia baltica, Strain CSIRO CS-38" /LENGTH=167 /DNA_ID=CAMNT_0010687701 /DNA_START=80 /DNA_END=581 /DNA_ORIENTATION=-